MGCSLNAGQIPALKKAAPKFQTFVDLIRSMQRLAEEVDLPTFYETLIQASGYGEMLSAKTDHESKSRLEKHSRVVLPPSAGIWSTRKILPLGGVLDEVALYTDLDSVEGGGQLRHPYDHARGQGPGVSRGVYRGMEEGVSQGSGPLGEEEELEEERRLCYVALTRAKERLYLTCAAQRMLFGRTSANFCPPALCREIPAERVQAGGKIRRPQQELLSDTGWSGEERFFSGAKAGCAAARLASGTRAAPAAYRKPAPKSPADAGPSKGRHGPAFGVWNRMVLTVQSMGRRRAAGGGLRQCGDQSG